MLVWGVAVQSVPETWDSRQNSRGSSACCHSRLAASKTARGRRRGSEDQHTYLHGMIKHRHGSSSRPPTPRPFLRPSPLESAKRLIITSSEHRVFTSLCCDTVDASTPTLLDLHETSGDNGGPTLIGKGGKKHGMPSIPSAIVLSRWMPTPSLRLYLRLSGRGYRIHATSKLAIQRARAVHRADDGQDGGVKLSHSTGTKPPHPHAT